MSIEIITLLMFGGLAFLLLTGIPIGFATGGIAVLATLFLWGPSSVFVIANRAYNWMSSPALVAIPLFIFMAQMLSHSGAIDDLFDAVYIWAGPIKGGLAIMTVLGATLMAAMSGIVGATEVTMGLVALPAMMKRKYNKHLALGCIAAGGSLGYLIPPSIIFVLYGLAADQSVGKLFMGGFGPGLLLAFLYIVYIIILAYVKPDTAPALPREERQAVSLNVKIGMTKFLFFPALLIFSVLGSIYMGIATITESAGIGAAGAILVALFHRRLNWSTVQDSCYMTIRVSSMILWLVIGSSAFISVYTAVGGTEFAKSLISSLPFGRWGTMIIMQMILIFLGCFIDWAGILTLTTPIFLPIIIGMGFDPIWYGVLFNVNMQISCLSPPFGPALFYLRGIAPPNVSMLDIYKSSVPFVAIQVLVLALCMIFPQIITFLPSLVN
ncbi:MAG: TRAP transporter large permease subunit [Desulfopila sp.]